MGRGKGLWRMPRNVKEVKKHNNEGENETKKMKGESGL